MTDAGKFLEPAPGYTTVQQLKSDLARRQPVVEDNQTDGPRRCDKCDAVCDHRIQVCECTPDCPYPPVVR